MLSDNVIAIDNGKLVADIKPNSSIESVVELLEKNLDEFSIKVVGQLSASEKALTDKLCKFLNRKADGYPFFFQHENVENHDSGSSPQVDIGTVSRSEQLVVEDRSYGEFDSFFSIEAKRLPTPSKEREREYVIGNGKPSGGIERFKRGIHGEGLKYAAILAYIQKEDYKHWFAEVNNWIDELIHTDNAFWKSSDKLKHHKGTKLLKTSKFVSHNFRVKNTRTDTIKILHFWVNIT